MLMGVEHVVVKSPLRRQSPWRSSARPRPLRGKSKAAGHASRSTIAVRMPAIAHQPAARRRCGSIDRQLRATVDGRIGRVGRHRRLRAARFEQIGRRSRSHPQVRVRSPWRRGDQGASDRDVRHLNGGNMDEGWTRWVLEQYGFRSTRLHRRRRQGRRALRQVRRDHPARDQSLKLDPRREYGEARTRPCSIAWHRRRGAWRR
jgi:hypothetical protein